MGPLTPISGVHVVLLLDLIEALEELWSLVALMIDAGAISESWKHSFYYLCCYFCSSDPLWPPVAACIPCLLLLIQLQVQVNDQLALREGGGPARLEGKTDGVLSRKLRG